MTNTLNQYTAVSDFPPSAYDADGNQTLVKTATGIWNVTYNTDNRPILFTRTEEDGTETQIACTYDHLGRRATKKVTVDGSITLHQRYLYRSYLQIAASDLRRSGEPCLWHITWDPTQETATRPLGIRKDGTWYCYGWDLTKNVCEVFKTNGGIGTTYAYTPYGLATPSGSITQPLQWSSEYADTETALAYYNYRHYNPVDGRWLSRDKYNGMQSLKAAYLYCNNRIDFTDYLGNWFSCYSSDCAIQWTSCPYVNPEIILRQKEIEKLREKCLAACDAYYNPAHDQWRDFVNKAGDANASVGQLPPGSGQNKGQDTFLSLQLLLLAIAHEKCKCDCYKKYRDCLKSK